MKKWDTKGMSEWDWKKHPLGGIIPTPGTAEAYPTGGWRTNRPVRDEEECNDCLLCVIYCPDAAIKTKDDKLSEINLEHCKGCGICARECPKKAIKMVDESAASDERGDK